MLPMGDGWFSGKCFMRFARPTTALVLLTARWTPWPLADPLSNQRNRQKEGRRAAWCAWRSIHRSRRRADPTLCRVCRRLQKRPRSTIATFRFEFEAKHGLEKLLEARKTMEATQHHAAEVAWRTRLEFRAARAQAGSAACPPADA